MAKMRKKIFLFFSQDEIEKGIYLPNSMNLAYMCFIFETYDLKYLQSIDEICIVNHKKDFITSKLIVEFASNKMDSLVKINPKEPRIIIDENILLHKYKIIEKLLKKSIIVDIHKISEKVFLKDLLKSTIVLNSFFFDARLIDFVKQLDHIDFYLSSMANHKIIKLIRLNDKSVHDFFEIELHLNKVRKEILLTPEKTNIETYISDNAVYMSNLFYDRDKSDSRFQNKLIFVGDYEEVLKYDFEFFLRDRKTPFVHDLKEGLPDQLPQNSDIILLNYDSLSKQETISLWGIIEGFKLENENFILHHSSFDNIDINFKRTFRSTYLRKPNEIPHYLTLFFYYMLLAKNKCTRFTRIYASSNDDFNFLLAKFNSFKELSLAIDSLPDNGNLENLYRSEFWYELIYCRNIDSTHNQEADTSGDYKILFRGDYWELSFGYEKPILMESKLGLFYVVHLMRNSGKTIDATELRKKITGPKSVTVSEGKSVPAIRKNVTEFIKHLEILETRINIGSDFSRYLSEIFIYPEQSCFKDKDDKCLCILPDTPKIKWQISTPTYYKP